ncbi:sensor histidine kinase [Pedobacter sp. PLR]|uniref:sensor histidine kinase n=1 Tax=Pedobacter sp. PLR TaxID=2994465 RepID=UPI002247ADB5|nr:sensor histidine kinase [Pedobacter sp. PLR]MCX2452849.1 sensor histidine kinase [Pedobacter sp. PLR]
MNNTTTPANQDFILWFHSYYTKERRIGLHVLMWLIYGAIIETSLLLTTDLSINASLLILIDVLLGNFIIFYPFFYFIYPHLIRKKKIILSILSTIALIYLWRVNGYLNDLLINQFSYIDDEVFRRKQEIRLQNGFLHIFTFERLFGGFIDIIYSLSPVFCLKIIVEMLKSAYRTTEMEKEKAAIEIAYLKSQLNPHFLFNTLNSIYILNMKEDEAAADVILDLSDTLRYTLYESNKEKVRLQQEIDFLNNYVNLERVRLNKKTSVVVNCDLSGVDALSISPLLMFPFLENAFKHGLGNSIENPWLEINVKVLDNTFHFDIKNSKEAEKNNNELKEYFGGIGVENTKKRLALLYPNRHILEIKSTSEYYHTNLKIKL